MHTPSGDGTVHSFSLDVCARWNTTTVKRYPGQSHVGLLSDETAVSDFASFVAGLIKMDDERIDREGAGVRGGGGHHLALPRVGRSRK